MMIIDLLDSDESRNLDYNSLTNPNTSRSLLLISLVLTCFSRIFSDGQQQEKDLNGAGEGEAPKTTEEETKIDQSNMNTGEEGQAEIKDQNSGVGESCFALIQFEKGE